MVRRVHFADQGETTGAESPTAVPPLITTAPPMPPADSGRPQRSRKPPGWVKDYDMESSCVRCRSLEVTSNVGGMYGMEDDNRSERAGQRDVSNPAYVRANQDGAGSGVDHETWHGVVQNRGAVHGTVGTFVPPAMQYPFYQYYYPM